MPGESQTGRYIETDPFTISFFLNGACVRFFRSVEQTCTEIAWYSPPNADACPVHQAGRSIVEFALTPFRMSEDT